MRDRNTLLRRAKGTALAALLMALIGKDCAAGGVVSRHGFLGCIEDEHLLPPFAEQDDAVLQAKKAGKMLGSILRERRG